MRLLYRAYLCFCSVLLTHMCAAPAAQAVGVPSLNVESLVANSDFVFVGRVISTRELGSRTMAIRGITMVAHIVEADSQIDKTLKGSERRGARFTYVVPSESVGYRGVPVGKLRVLFLKGNVAEWTLTDPYYPSLPAGEGAEATGNVFDAVVNAVTRVLLVPGADEAQKLEAVAVLRRIHTDQATHGLESASNDGSAAVQATAIGALLARHEISKLSTAVSLLENRSLALPLRQSLDSGIYEGVRSDKAIPLLAGLLNAPDPQTREAAAMGIRNCECQAAVGSLSAALENPDRHIRYLAVVGLAEITGQTEWRPLEDEFDRQENKYLEYWKSWSRRQ